MKNQFYGIILIAFCSLLLTRCNKNDTLIPSKISDYTNMGVGKFVIYKLDSTVTLSFGVGFTVHSYLVKDSIDGMVTDNLNRPGYHIVRYTWDTAARQWNNSNTFLAVQTGKVFEYTENNLRQTRLISPIGGSLNWQGNSFMGVSPFNFISNDDDYLDWTFSYSNAGQPFKVGNQTFDSTITVVQYDSMNNKSQDPNFISNYSKSYEVYAKGVGKIFQDLFSWEYQASYATRNCLLIHCENNKCDTTKIACDSDGSAGNNCSAIATSQASLGVRIVCDTIPGNFTYNGYGVRLSIMNHN
jgi:hypothetical protein